jgi:hypothetical protein
MLGIDPNSGIAQNNLAVQLLTQGQYQEAESLAIACVNRGQFANCPYHAIRAQLLQRKPAAAETTLARWGRNSPDDPQMLWSRFGVASWRGDYAEAARFRERSVWLRRAANTFRRQSTRISEHWRVQREDLERRNGSFAPARNCTRLEERTTSTCIRWPSWRSSIFAIAIGRGCARDTHRSVGETSTRVNRPVRSAVLASRYYVCAVRTD